MKYLLSFFIFISVHLGGYACDCAFPPKTFMTSISQYTAELEVVQIDTLSSAGPYKHRPLLLTKLKVIKTFHASTNVDYVWVSNPGDQGCQRGLVPDFLGQKYVITGVIVEDKRYDKWINNSASMNFLHVSICGKRVLDIIENKVIGVITNDISEKIMKKYDRLMKKDELKATAYYYKAYHTKQQPNVAQTMPLEVFYEFMKQ